MSLRQRPPWSRRRPWVVGGVAVLLAAAVALVGLAVGEYPLPLPDVLAALSGRGSPLTYDVVVRTRLPRVLVALLVGAALGLSGAVLQRLAGNVLVSPDVVGVNAGAAAGAVVMVTVVGAGGAGVAAGALAGAAGAAALVGGLGRGGGPQRLVLTGVGVSALGTAVATHLVTRAERSEAHAAAVWLVGSVAGRDAGHVVTAALALAVLGPAVLLAGRTLRALDLGPDVARALGVRVGAARGVLVAAAVGLAALATAAAGPVAFVALAAPRLAALLAGSSAGPAAACGALLVGSADLALRLLPGTGAVPVGVATALVGAPVLLLALSRTRSLDHP